MKSKLPTLCLLAVFVFSFLFSALAFNFTATTVYAAPVDDARNRACNDNSVEDACREGFNKGVRGGVDGKNEQDTCGSRPVGGGRTPPPPQAVSTYHGCGEGFKFAKNNPQQAKESVGSDAGSTQDDDTVDCDAKLNSILSWIACPLIDLGVGMADGVFENFVQPMLATIPVSTQSDSGSYRAWQQFRIIANVLLVGTLLMIVYSQAKGGGK